MICSMFYWQSYHVHYAIHIYALFININSKLYILHWNFFIGCSFFYWQLHQVFYAIHIYSLFINKYSIFNIHYWTFNVRFAKTILHYVMVNLPNQYYNIIHWNEDIHFHSSMIDVWSSHNEFVLWHLCHSITKIEWRRRDKAGPIKHNDASTMMLSFLWKSHDENLWKTNFSLSISVLS